MTTTVRIDEQTYKNLRALASAIGAPMQNVLAQAVEAYRRKWFLQAANDDYARLRADATAWADELDERRLWDATLLDGLEGDPCLHNAPAATSG
ncbi:MAG: toxin-antitoxin system protein [Dehalococcoidia bacterium]